MDTEVPNSLILKHLARGMRDANYTGHLTETGDPMRVHRLTLLPVALILLAACGRDDKVDDALKQDLSLASQAYMPQQFMSPIEAGYAQGAYYQPGYAPQPYGGYQPAVARSAPRVVRSSTVSSGTVARTGGATRVIKNTKRDAAIGAVAGAAIGAVTSGKSDRLKGAVLGAAAGAILGGVIGNNVDIKRVPR